MLERGPCNLAAFQTGSYYGRPRIRNRPIYPHLPTDQKADRATVTDGGGTIGCSKYYQLYGRKGLTGGLMVAWCTHSCCIGFHCIPRGEGRNDVFSALFCYWERAPEFVIYDFSCALAAYCMLREAQFFRHTRFLIDIFHSKGHTRCSKACFLSAYRAYSARLQGLNSSAGESGNAGLLKIRKPLSYMSQRHAVIFSYVFLAIWNRQRRRKLLPKIA
ncbi:hypothetical protein AURDEDRAFT_74154 [Auricularia subglabra TFB-10046 SS5]|uniref:CxC2-like cysteine cluster KDZ transposase-associated domain-containing protein n=1 Tax=Auricularia subglabra (strain TFB-10046 / SS5) TaxID=717982 RepID=J0CYS8_AURST|nr:hypothetical protein AURDEDRAFT_74154 [Auricularia subglabra TFB-10046 SS5]